MYSVDCNVGSLWVWDMLEGIRWMPWWMGGGWGEGRWEELARRNQKREQGSMEGVGSL